ncbi:hypothetical protein HYH02_010238 [Chlamydomonas schloesseri]|uniref:Uncharacterized protein n=1 Tax=Chlamydomonas schloesseri TaxID=2026947 RepID=A0A835THW1_9CHLO|nr:hypothetical protein HYH02_010238 [Chlamydomonas schloesseri]|eukprot:KAG2440659.1 hypothetical protein HYH02_010238 [Chlamydomonas schloesseri]
MKHRQPAAVAARLRANRAVTKAVAEPLVSRDDEGLRLRGPQTLVLPTIFARSGSALVKANVVLPTSAGKLPQEGDPPRTVTARGVVLFMHGFAQGPTAYARMLTQLAEEEGVVVVAPCPDSSTSPQIQQDNMVKAAAFWRQLIAANELPGLKLASSATSAPDVLPVGFLGHSVGGGLAPYVVDAAARAGQPYAVAHVMAPQTSQVVETYNYTAKANKDRLLPPSVATSWAVQYGWIDLLSFAWDVNAFRAWLRGKGRLGGSVSYELGTHVGFEDQLVVLGESFSTDVLPWVLAVLWGALAVWLPALGLSGLRQLHEKSHARAPAGAGAAAAAVRADDEHVLRGVEGAAPAAPGFGPPDDVELPDERVMAAGYLALAATVTAIEMALPPFAWDSPGHIATSVLKALFLVLSVGSWPALVVYPYEAAKQRPEARRQVRTWFRNTLVLPVTAAAGGSVGAGVGQVEGAKAVTVSAKQEQ